MFVCILGNQMTNWTWCHLCLCESTCHMDKHSKIECNISIGGDAKANTKWKSTPQQMHYKLVETWGWHSPHLRTQTWSPWQWDDSYADENMLCMDEIVFISMAYFDGRCKNNVCQCSFLEYNRGPTNKVFVGTLDHVGGHLLHWHAPSKSSIACN